MTIATLPEYEEIVFPVTFRVTRLRDAATRANDDDAVSLVVHQGTRALECRHSDVVASMTVERYCTRVTEHPVLV